MIDGDTAINLMRMELDRFPIKYRGRQGTQYAIRCPFCGDSAKNLRHPHFYIKVSPDNREGIPFFSFDCKLCTKKAKFMTLKDARKIGIENEQLLEYIDSISKTRSNNIASGGSNVIAKRLECDLPNTVDIGIKKKLEYIYNRLEDDDIIQNPEKYKIIIDPLSFFMKNKLPLNYDYQDPKRLLRTMQNCCVGFLSFDNTHINFRDITGTLENRYTQYMIYSESVLKQDDKTAETSGMYIVPTKINTMNPSLKIKMAEGSFDILRAFTDFHNHDHSQGIFASVSNSHGYIPCLTKMMEYGMLFDEVDIYSDSDVELSFYRNMVKPIIPNAVLRVYYNNASKDIGDKTKPLKLSRISL